MKYKIDGSPVATVDDADLHCTRWPARLLSAYATFLARGKHPKKRVFIDSYQAGVLCVSFPRLSRGIAMLLTSPTPLCVVSSDCDKREVTTAATEFAPGTHWEWYEQDRSEDTIMLLALEAALREEQAPLRVCLHPWSRAVMEEEIELVFS